MNVAMNYKIEYNSSLSVIDLLFVFICTIIFPICVREFPSLLSVHFHVVCDFFFNCITDECVLKIFMRARLYDILKCHTDSSSTRVHAFLTEESTYRH